MFFQFFLTIQSKAQREITLIQKKFLLERKASPKELEKMLLNDLLKIVRNCSLCKDFLPFPPNPILKANSKSKILIIGQAPGTKVQSTGIPWNDPSGDKLRIWMGIDKEIFYNEELISIIPMGFCYPGKGKSGDLPPRPECAKTWHPQLLPYLKEIQLILLIGKYSQNYYLPEHKGKSLTETVRDFQNIPKPFFPLVHPSPRNKLWLKKNPWFEMDMIPILRRKVKELL